MTTAERAQLRRLYSTACHGAGAQARKEARLQIEVLLRQCNTNLRESFEAERLDMSAYFASRPMS